LQALETKLGNVVIDDEEAPQGSKDPNQIPSLGLMSIPGGPPSSIEDPDNQTRKNLDAFAFLTQDFDTSDSDPTVTDDEDEHLSLEELAKAAKHVQKLLKRITKLQHTFDATHKTKAHGKKRVHRIYQRFCRSWEDHILPSQQTTPPPPPPPQGMPARYSYAQTEYDLKPAPGPPQHFGGLGNSARPPRPTLPPGPGFHLHRPPMPVDRMAPLTYSSPSSERSPAYLSCSAHPSAQNNHPAPDTNLRAKTPPNVSLGLPRSAPQSSPPSTSVMPHSRAPTEEILTPPGRDYDRSLYPLARRSILAENDGRPSTAYSSPSIDLDKALDVKPDSSSDAMDRDFEGLIDFDNLDLDLSSQAATEGNHEFRYFDFGFPQYQQHGFPGPDTFPPRTPMDLVGSNAIKTPASMLSHIHDIPPPPKPTAVTQSPAMMAQLDGQGATPASLMRIQPSPSSSDPVESQHLQDFQDDFGRDSVATDSSQFERPIQTHLAGSSYSFSGLDVRASQLFGNGGTWAEQVHLSEVHAEAPHGSSANTSQHASPMVSAIEPPFRATNQETKVSSSMTVVDEKVLTTPGFSISNGEKGDPRFASRAQKKNSNCSTLVSPALRPKISPSLKLLGSELSLSSSKLIPFLRLRFQPLIDGTDNTHADDPHALLSAASKSNHQNILDGTTIPDVIYPISLSKNLTSKRTSHKIVEQGRRNRINRALQELEALLPSPKFGGSVMQGLDPAASQHSKAAKVEGAVVYIRQLQQELSKMDRLIEANYVPTNATDQGESLPFTGQEQLQRARQEQRLQEETLPRRVLQSVEQPELHNGSQEQKSKETARGSCFACQRAHLTCGKPAFL
jgi:hypothetical protein